MNRSTITTIVVLVVLVLAGAGLWAATKSAGNQTGNVVLAFTDQTATINNVSEVDMTVNKIEAHSQNGGWVTLSNESRVFHLLSLNASGKLSVYDQVKAPADQYDQVKVTFGDVKVMMKDGSSQVATLPSHSLLVNDTLKVSSDETSAVTFDVNAKESLHSTKDARFVFAPVVAYRSLVNASIDVGSDDTVTISNSQTASSGNVGMDVSGDTKINFMIDAGADLNIDGDSVILGGNASSSSDASGSVKTPSPHGSLPIIGATSTNTTGGVINY